MQLILLSGGSGKRLWPLSNNIRSKQFLSLFKRNDGKMESMLQRVVRQVMEEHLTDNITIATNDSQSEIITTQLGNNISIVTEPERRDTFPAIALATSYLVLKKQCPEDEVGVVMPCDSLVDENYFKKIKRMVQLVQQDVAELILMGIKPTYPSSKFGYILPLEIGTTDSDCLFVKKFVEKPSVDIAQKLLLENALWNGGVFAFRLNFLMNIIQKYVQLNSFEDVRTHYYSFPKISFDYDVAEKVTSAVVTFDGKWKDIGTWNALTEELEDPVIGKVILGKHCKNVNVISELQSPIFIDGLEDVVVSANKDGVFICSKKYSEDIKQYIETIH